MRKMEDEYILTCKRFPIEPGDFIQFDRLPQLVASVEGAPVFICHYGTHNARYALRIDECLRGDDPHWLGGSHVH